MAHTARFSPPSLGYQTPMEPASILILSGNYTEQVNANRSGPVCLLGQTSNAVNVIWAAVAGTGDNAYTPTSTVAPNLNADTNTTFTSKYGAYITDSYIHKANSRLSMEGKCALGRPI
ncbi:MAG: hypothetical protein LQ340_006777 [Diploschistes diacapsis]|nr:MAG: hypothetical protein LQ340_006777 [Diploschistes diacapsis]